MAAVGGRLARRRRLVLCWAGSLVSDDGSLTRDAACRSGHGCTRGASHQVYGLTRQPPPNHPPLQGWSKQKQTYQYKDGSTWRCNDKCTDAHGPIYEAVIFNPLNGKWSAKGSLSEMMQMRLYHSTAILLPDCRVSFGWAGTPHCMVGGTWCCCECRLVSCGYGCTIPPHAPAPVLLTRLSSPNPPPLSQVMVAGSDVTNGRTAEIFTPPHLLTKRPRPQILQGPDVMRPGPDQVGRPSCDCSLSLLTVGANRKRNGDSLDPLNQLITSAHFQPTRFARSALKPLPTDPDCQVRFAGSREPRSAHPHRHSHALHRLW